MKILITGLTPLQCKEDYYLEQQLKVVPSEQALTRILRELGHEVEQRAVQWGEDLDGYDKVITFLCGTDSFVVRHIAGALWTLYNRPDGGVALDDYQCSRTLRDGNQRPHAKWKDTFKQLTNLDVSNRELFDSVHFDWMKNKKVLIPAFYGGDHNKLFTKAKRRHGEWFTEQNLQIFGYYPDPWLEARGPVGEIPSEKDLEWVVAGLSKENRAAASKWNPTLPVIELGGKGENGVRMVEPEAIEWFSTKWLHCIPSYDHKGSGWWRSRPVQLANAGVVSYCHPEEAVLYGPSWVIDDPLELEALSATELQELAIKQSNDFFVHQPQDKQRPVDDLRLFLESL